MEHDNRTDEPSSGDMPLTFAVIWDPENGLEAFSSAQLFDAPADVSVISGHDFDFDCWSDESSSVQSEEPFAVFGGRQLHFIDIRTSNMYKNIIDKKFDNEPPSTPSSASSYSAESWRSSCCVQVNEAVFDPPTPVQPIRPPEPPMVRLSQDSFFLLNTKPLWKGRACTGWKARRPAMLKPLTLVDDEGFFDVSSHADCDPHLVSATPLLAPRAALTARADDLQPSRFSISTTSTSAYIAVNRAASGPATPMALSHAHTGALAAANRKEGPGVATRASWAYKLPGALSPTVRFSKLLPPWLKRPRDERWVLVDVRAIVLERVVDG